MSAKGLPWLRLYGDIIRDAKIISLAAEDRWYFVGILAMKTDGTLDQKCAEHVMDRLVAQALFIDFAIIGEVKRRLVDAELIRENWQPVAWAKRQKRSDADKTASERKRRERERKSLQRLTESTARKGGLKPDPKGVTAGVTRDVTVPVTRPVTVPVTRLDKTVQPDGVLHQNADTERDAERDTRRDKTTRARSF